MAPRGRPSLPEDEKHLKRLHVAMTAEELAAIDLAAAEKEEKRSAWVRRVLAQAAKRVLRQAD